MCFSFDMPEFCINVVVFVEAEAAAYVACDAKPL